MKTFGLAVLLTAVVLSLVVGAIALGSVGRDGAAGDAAASLTDPEPRPPAMSGDLTRFGTGWCAAPSDAATACSST